MRLPETLLRVGAIAGGVVILLWGPKESMVLGWVMIVTAIWSMV